MENLVLPWLIAATILLFLAAYESYTLEKRFRELGNRSQQPLALEKDGESSMRQRRSCMCFARLFWAVILGLGLGAMWLRQSSDSLCEQSSLSTLAVKAAPSLSGNVFSASPSYTYYFPVLLQGYQSPQWKLLGLEDIWVKQVALAPKVNTLYVMADAVFNLGPELLYKSENGGSDWISISEGIDARIQSFFVHPVTPTLLLAGTLGGDGVYYSDDAGQHWLTSSIDPFIRSVAAHPTTPTVWLAASFNPLTPETARIQRTADAGVSWHTVTSETTIVNAFVFDPDDTTRVYACTNQGLLISTDAAVTWIYASPMGCENLVIHPYTSTMMYASSGTHLLMTEDQGLHWNSILTAEQNLRTFAIYSETPDVLYVATLTTLYQSVDAGYSWRVINRPAYATFHYLNDLTIDQSGTVYLGTDQGIWCFSSN